MGRRGNLVVLATASSFMSAHAAAQDQAGGAEWSWSGIVRVVQENGASFAMKLVGAIALWMIGRFLIRWAVRLMQRGFERSKMDPTLGRYLGSSLSVLLTVVLIVAILGFFGVETTSFAALMAGAGLAIGAAWSGLLSNFAAGIFLVVLKPYKVGDFISAAGVTGTVREIGLFTTTVDTPDNVETVIGNGKIFSDNIQNFTTNPYRRVDLLAQLSHEADHDKALALLREAMAKIPNVMSDPAPTVEILEMNLSGPVLAVRPSTHNDHYWQVYFDGNRAIREVLGAAGYAVPWQRHRVEETMLPRDEAVREERRMPRMPQGAPTTA